MTRSFSNGAVGGIFDAAVLGGGVIGAAIAGSAAELEMSVTLIERGSVGAQGASRYSGGIVRAYDPDEAIRTLAVYSLARMADTEVGRAFASCIARSGVYYAPRTAPSAAALAWRSQTALPDYPIDVVSTQSVTEAVGVFYGRKDGVVYWEPAGGLGDVCASARAAIQQVRRTGLVLENTRICDIEWDGSGVTVWLEGGCIRARCLVVALGGWTDQPFTRQFPPLKNLFVRSVPMVRFAREQSLRVPVIDEVAESYMAPFGRRAVQIGSRVRVTATKPEDLEYDEAAIITDACSRLHRITGTSFPAYVIDVVPGFDCFSQDGRPTVGQLGESNVFVATGLCGIGYKLAVGIGRLASLQIAAHLEKQRLHDREKEILRPFCPSRLAQTGPLIREDERRCESSQSKSVSAAH